VIAPIFAPGVEQELFFQAQVPHGYKLLSTIRWHAHLYTMLAGNGAQFMQFGLEYWLSPINGQAPANSSFAYTAQLPVSTTARYHQVCEFESAPGVDLEMGPTTISAIILGRIFRLATDTYPYGVRLLGTDGHCQVDTLGSKTEASK
jgi:hypothetical protein